MRTHFVTPEAASSSGLSDDGAIAYKFLMIGDHLAFGPVRRHSDLGYWLLAHPFHCPEDVGLPLPVLLCRYIVRATGNVLRDGRVEFNADDQFSFDPPLELRKNIEACLRRELPIQQVASA